VTASGFTVNSSTSITVAAPAHALGVVDVSVTTPYGTATKTGGFEYAPPPRPAITGISPSSGPTTGGTSVVISGSNFTGATAVKFGSKAATSFSVDSATKITAVAPAGSAGTVDVKVTTAGGTSPASSADRFTYRAPPTVTAVSPSSGPTGGGTAVTVTGTNFTGATAVAFGGIAATSFTVNSATRITAVTPANTAGGHYVRVTTAGGTSATGSAAKFFYVVAPPPTVTAVSPSSGATAGGTTVTVTGTNFTGATAVAFGGIAATSFTVNSATRITAVSPANTAGAHYVRVTTAGGISATGSATRFTYVTVSAPTVTAVSPSSGATSGGTSITITGTNLTGATTVKFGTAAATSFTVTSATRITAVAPAHSAGAVDVRVTTAGGTSATSSADRFTYSAASKGPTVTSLFPNSGPTTGGSRIVITGTNFTGATAVKFGTTAATSFAINSATQIVATSPPGTGFADVTVTTAAGTSATGSTDQFSYQSASGNPRSGQRSIDSDNSRSIQRTIGPMVAQTSAQVMSGAVDQAITDAFGDGGPAFNVSATGIRLNSAGDMPSKPERSETATAYADQPRNPRIDEAYAALASADKARKAATKFRPEREWSFWTEIKGTGWKVTDTVPATGATESLTGQQLNVTGGLTRKLTPDMLVGVMAGYESFNFDIASLGGGMKGHGLTVGGYFARRFGDLRFDVSAAWSPVSYDVNAGASTGSIDGNRWIVSTGLTGTKRFGNWLIEPSVKLYMLWERDQAWTDSLGATQDAHNFSSGRVSVGSKIAHSFKLDGDAALVPSVGLYADNTFMSDDALPTGQPTFSLKNGWAARVTTGVNYFTPGGASLGLTGELGGLGSNYKIWSGMVSGALPF
jgi:hypothetical protein